MNSRIEKQNIENVLFFDIETVSGSEELKVDSREYDLFEWKNRNRDTDEVLPQSELLDLYKRKAALSSTHSKIVCISLGYVKDNKIYVMSITGAEYDVITEFCAIASKTGKVLCGWNIIGFDLPTVRKRAFANGFTEWKIGKANDSGAKPWTLAEGVLDLMVEYKGTSYVSESMDEVCYLLDIPSPKDKLSGSQVTGEFYKNGVANIATYCEKDVIAVIDPEDYGIVLEELNGNKFNSPNAGVFLFTPFLAQLKIGKVVQEAGLPGSKLIPAISYLLSFLSLKLIGTERYAHAGEHGFDTGLGLFAGLNVLPKCTAMSTYAYSLDEVHLLRLQQSFIRQASKVGLYNGNIINLDFHTIPHFGDESVLEEHWAGARSRRMKGALTLFAQDAETKLILYTAADILREEANDQVLSFLSFWNSVQRGVKPMLVFDSRFTTYPKLSELNDSDTKFITLRRRGKKLIDEVDHLPGWRRIRLDNTKRKYPNPQVHESTIRLRGYEGELRQIIVRGNGREKPAFIITNDFHIVTAAIVGTYGRRWRIENGISEAVKFFNINSLSSPILVKVHFDVTMTMIADTLYSMLAQKLRGFEECDAPKLYRHFVRGKAAPGSILRLGATSE